MGLDLYSFDSWARLDCHDLDHISFQTRAVQLQIILIQNRDNHMITVARYMVMGTLHNFIIQHDMGRKYS
jgi:hypothetical protein